MPKFTTKTEYQTVIKEYDIKEHHKNIEELLISHNDYNGMLQCKLIEGDKSKHGSILTAKTIAVENNLDEIVVFRPEHASFTPTYNYNSSVFKNKAGCVLIDFKPVKPLKRVDKILICSEELNNKKIDESKLNKLVDKITYP